MHKKILPIRGMHCRSCEVLISEALKEIPGVKNVSIKHKDKEATVYSEKEIPTPILSEAVSKAGYEVGIDDSNSWISLNALDYKHFAIGLLIFIILYLIARSIGLFNLNASGSGNPSSLGVVLLVGLTAGISTCMALVGGLVLGISARHREKHPEATSFQNFRPHLFFNLGRISSYFILGGVIGLAGKAFQLSGPTLGVMTIVVGLIMLILGIQISGLFPKVTAGGISIPGGIARILGLKKHNEKEYSHTNSILIGALTFFLPCGFTQAMQLYAISTGSFISGALIMGIFALGTAPGLLGIGGLTSIIKGKTSAIFFKFVAITLIAMAIFNVTNGFNLTGWKIGSNKAEEATINDPNVKIENGVQVVYMTQTSGGYKPNKFTIKKELPVKWVIDSKSSNSCASSIYLPKYNIRDSLSLGINTIEFIPKEQGEIKFSCSMGMYSGKFIVTE